MIPLRRQSQMDKDVRVLNKGVQSSVIHFRETKVYSESSLKEGTCFMYWIIVSNDKRVMLVLNLSPVDRIHILQFEPILVEQSDYSGQGVRGSKFKS